MSVIQASIARNRNGEAVRLACFCTANEHVLRAVLTYAEKTGFRPWLKRLAIKLIKTAAILA